jgi:hypothetical protein
MAPRFATLRREGYRFATLRREGYQQPRSVGVRSGSPEVLFPPVIGNERNGI